MKVIMSGLSIVLLCVSVLSAQQVSGVCGYSTAGQVEHLIPRVQQYNQQLAVSERNDIQYVPIYFHLVADVNGNGRLKDRFVLDQLCDLNEAYASMDIRFYLNPHPTYGLLDKSINSNTVYSNQSNTFTMNNRRHLNALNVFAVDQVVVGGGGPSEGTILGFNNDQFDWVVSRKDQVNNNDNGTVAHEIGHFFALSHTFLGYESNPFDGVDDPTWPIAPVTSPGGTLTERANGSNCQTAADQICDTPEDYNFGYVNSGCSPYTGIAKDPLGEAVDPMENNFMSYFINCGNYEFTPGQSSIVLSDLASNSRNYLDNSFSPASTAITVPNDLLISPIGGVTQEFFDEVMLQWQSVPGATYYLVEFDISTFFATNFFQSVIVPASTTSMLMTSLLPNRNYYWRVRPFNEYVTCEPGKTSSFRTPLVSAVQSIEGLEAWNVFPNPALSSDVAYVAVKANNGFTANVSMVDPSGKIVYEQRAIQVDGGETTITLPLEGLSNGIYFVVLQSATGRDVRKLTVLK